jgi:hypothetical protein
VLDALFPSFIRHSILWFIRKWRSREQTRKMRVAALLALAVSAGQLRGASAVMGCPYDQHPTVGKVYDCHETNAQLVVQKPLGADFVEGAL